MKTLAGAGLIVLPIACCVGVSLIAAGVSVAVAAWIGGIAVVVVVGLLSAAAVLGLRLRRRAGERFPSLPTERSRT